ncbi:fimbria/pilus periplasmic chaperone [Escherichia coli]|uniref:fimbria/pilus periplasmic chaperone n=1 Tax=Escherichia coli TaxID=562 RepID=UPI001D972B07|nr:fimbria/pilus periplasmic chaperone [Escherichia coli]EGI4003411.1 fimbria/pilus periplasmic chaperone [Escherichia coli]EGI4008682.1 fimbria/pilus periplasmic chaperone [Escherichia coli]EGI4023181.1 fimbria/pilus periplasmic chaperone [Escherichia coli]EGI4028319.1 fimbria/pilus periplasmic chaperone [Escherichia coli]
MKSLFDFALLCLTILYCHTAISGITLGASRVIYPVAASQTSISVKNDTDTSTYLVQSWVENGEGVKSSDFIVTPPLYMSAPGNENTLRIVSANSVHVRDKERLYYLNVKTVPSVDKYTLEKANTSLVVATVMRIKMFVRPDGLRPPREKAENALTFTHRGDHIDIFNPTPYYLTLTDLKAGEKGLGDVMIPPQSHELVTLPAGWSSNVTWLSINDYGGADKGQSTLR